MKTITFKTDEAFFEKVNDLAKHLHLSKSELIRRAVTEYEELIYKREIKKQMKQASFRVRESSAKINYEFDDSLNDIGV